ncbi:MAG TPA: HlyD family efflux transporter periplasmic adaptor subunit [Candidatus Limiplasma sp.]|nr:HlyD family efflux transporter periplasmic adaptor subunit [Candidatus Limiplasma sp.]
MAKQKPKKKGIVRLIRAIIIVVIIAIVGLIGVNYLLPMLTSDSVNTYESYTVETGDIETWMSFSATLEVKNSETYTASETTKVKELYVTSGDAVSEGDPLVLLTNGELLTASFDGVVNEIRVSVGDWVRPYFSVVQVSDLVNLEVTMEVDEYDVKSLTVGQSCTVKVISLDEDFETTISHINRVSSSSGTLAYYTVTCDLSVPEEVLPGMRSTVIIPDESVTDVAMLPMDALAFDGDQAYTLLKDAKGNYEEQYVETGLSDGVNVEIVSGLDIGDVVYAVSGTESINAAFSLEDLYIALVGEKVVINQTGGQMMGGTMPSGFSGDGTAWTGATDTDGSSFTPPSSEDMPDMSEMPDTGDMPDRNAETDSDTAASGENAQDTQDAQDVQDVQDLLDLQDTQDEQTSDTNTEP